MPDLFKQHPELLQGQPKRTIAEYVENEGILVPKRFASLEEAITSNSAVLVRSENPQDYDGEGNLFHSTILDKRRKNYEKLRAHMLSLPENKINRYKEPQDWLQKTKSETSYSFWEFIGEGENRTMVADNGIPDRYHILTTIDRTYDRKFSGEHTQWVIIEGGEVVFGEADFDLEKEIGFYEKVRHLECFDPNHCPSIEYQVVGEDIYFLQYFRTNDFQEADFVLERDLEEGEIMADFVRGATPEQGVLRKVHFPQTGGTYSSPELGGKIHHAPFTLAELQGYISSVHTQIAQVFKPAISVCTEIESLYTKQELLTLFSRSYGLTDEKCLPDFEPPTIRFISDGRTAYLKRMD